MTSECNAVVILAGGVGRRVGTEVPKHLLEVVGHTIAAFESHPAVDEIVLAIARGHLDAVRTIVCRRGQARSSTSSRAAQPAPRRPRRWQG